MLHDLEKKHDIRILMAVNSGSRSFGYASAKSDWDVRFIYVHRPEWYFSIVKTEDTIEIMLEEEHLDIEGYDLKKALILLVKTNPVVSDWLHSNDYFIIDENFKNTMLSFESQCYNPHHAMYHFYSTSVKQNLQYLNENKTLKRFIYYMRGLLSCRWVEQNCSHPPVDIDELIDATITDSDAIKKKAHDILDLKRTGKSQDIAIPDIKLVTYMSKMQEYYKELLPVYLDTKQKVDIPVISRFLMNTVLEN